MESTKLLGIYSNGMVLQRNKKIIIEGYESASSSVTVTLAGQSVTAPVVEGRFKAEFEPMDVVFDTELKVEGTDTITLKDVCIGDVYLLAGQSNMELPVERTLELNREEVEAKDYPYVRQYLLTPDLEIPNVGDSMLPRGYSKKRTYRSVLSQVHRADRRSKHGCAKKISMHQA